MAPGNNNSTAPWNKVSDAFKPSLAFLVMIFGALVAFEFFNYSTTEHALTDMLGTLTFLGIPWATILALAFCGIDFAGIARLFTPETGRDEPKEVWYLFGAWLLAATMNAILTWWGVSMAVSARTDQNAVVDQKTLITVIPVFVAVLVWVIRILIIGTLSLSLDRLVHPETDARSAVERRSASYYDPQYESTRSPFNGAQPTISRAAQAQQRYSQGKTPMNFTPRTEPSAPQEPLYEDEDQSPQAYNRPNNRTPQNGSSYHTLSMKGRPGAPEGDPGSDSRRARR